MSRGEYTKREADHAVEVLAEKCNRLEETIRTQAEEIERLRNQEPVATVVTADDRRGIVRWIPFSGPPLEIGQKLYAALILDKAGGE